jgi:hypothetical protein
MNFTEPVAHSLVVFCVAMYLQIQVSMKLSNLHRVGLRRLRLFLLDFLHKGIMFCC